MEERRQARKQVEAWLAELGSRLVSQNLRVSHILAAGPPVEAILRAAGSSTALGSSWALTAGGGFPIWSETLREELLWARDAAAETVRWVARFDFPGFQRDYTFVALQPDGEYPFNEGPLASSAGLHVPAAEFESHCAEHQVPYSNALHCTLDGASYLTGPLARLHLNAGTLTPLARAVLADTGLPLPLRNPFHGIVARAVEILYAADEALRIVEAYVQPDEECLPFTVRAGTGTACTEAPRGVLYHRYAVSEDGTIREAKIVPPTSQNQRRIEEDLRAFVGGWTVEAGRECARWTSSSPSMGRNTAGGRWTGSPGCRSPSRSR